MVDDIYIIVFLVSILAGYAAHVYMKNRRFWELMSAFNGDPTIPIFGNAHQFPTDTAGIFNKLEELWLKHSGSTYKLILGRDVFVMLFEPENIEIILSNNKEIGKTNDYEFFAQWLGDGLLLSSGNKWRKQRKIITPTFHFKILEQFVSVFNNKSNIFIKKLAGNKDKIINIYPFVTLCTLDIICETAMGTNINSQIESESEYVKAVYRMSQLLTFRSFSMLKRISAIYQFTAGYREEQKLLKILHGTTNRVIQSRKLDLKNQMKDDIALSVDEDPLLSGRKKVAFLDLLLQSKTPEGEPLSDEVIREEVDTFMFEGHDTTSSALSFTLYLLANNPEQQKLAFDEQLSIFGNDLKRDSTYSDLQDMKYLERAIKESLRLYPPVPFFGRRLEDDLQLSDGKIVPKGAFIGIQHFFMSRNPKYFPEPLKFDPDRFLAENLRKSNPFAYVPFSAGPRNCIGQKFAMLELKSTISKVLRNYELISAGEKFEVILVNEVILKSKNGIHLMLKDRVYEK